MPSQKDDLSSFDIHLFREGCHYRTWGKMGAHLGEKNGQQGCGFAVWAPNAKKVSVICNFTPVPYDNYNIGLPLAGGWKEELNSDSTYYGGSGIGNAGEVVAESRKMHGFDYSANFTVPPLAIIILKPDSPRAVEGEQCPKQSGLSSV